MVGSDQYLTKPFTKETLLEAVQTFAVQSILRKRKKTDQELSGQEIE